MSKIHPDRSILLKLGLALGMLLVATLACYTPWRKAEAEREAIVQFSLVEKEIHTPLDAVLLAETLSSRRDIHTAFAGMSRIYVSDHFCEEVVAEYRDAMTSIGWVAGSGSCDQVIWLMMVHHTYEARFTVRASPPEGSKLAEEWQHLQGQYLDQTLYYVNSNVGVEYREP
jgi:hypothetical protein